MTLFSMLVSCIGGLALLLYGFSVSGRALEEVAGGRFRCWMAGVVRSRLLGAGFGALLTLLLQSSSATTVLLVGLARAGALSTVQAIPILLGADIGTTFTVQLIALDIYAFSPLMIALGVFLASYAKSKRIKNLGSIVLGLGFVFFGLHLMMTGLKPVASYPFVLNGLQKAHDWPLLVLGVTALLTALFHSSAATLGMAIAMGFHGMITIHAAMPMILGANLGTCGTALMAGWQGSVEAKRVAAAHCLLKLLGVALFFPLITPFADILSHATPALPRQIAHAHTFFNLSLLVLFLPLSTPFANWVTRLIAAPPPKEDPARPKYLDPKLLETPPFALEQAALESFRMAGIVREMLMATKPVLTEEENPVLLREIKQREDVVDHLNREIKLYLIKLSSSLSEKESEREMGLIHFIGHLENIGDIIDNNLLELGRKKVEEKIYFSEDGLGELHQLHQRVCQDFDAVLAAYAEDCPDRAERVIEGRGTFHQEAQQLRAAHMKRLHHGDPNTISSSAVHLDIITHFARIRSHITAMAHLFVEQDDWRSA